MKAVISGYGKMGRMIERILLEKGIEIAGKSESITDFDRQLASESVCIDFTTPESFRKNYGFLAENFKAAVIGTTGWNDIRDKVIRKFEECGTPMVYASNFSIGVNIMFRLAEYASKLMSGRDEYDSYILELHHRHKLDAPSGTASTIASIVKDVRSSEPAISSIRCGEIPGIHTLGFESASDRITIRHEAFSREGFARGAVEAAMIVESISGAHEFKDLIKI